MQLELVHPHLVCTKTENAYREMKLKYVLQGIMIAQSSLFFLTKMTHNVYKNTRSIIKL